MAATERIVCHDCDALYRTPSLAPGEKARCTRCEAVVYEEKREPLTRPLALALAGLLLFVPANFLPLLSLSLEGRAQEMTIFGGAAALWEQGLHPLAAFVFAVSVAAPALRLAGLLYLLLPLRLGRVPWRLPHMARLTDLLGPWGMLEVYLLGVIVAFVKLADLATVVPGPAFYAFVALIVVTTAAASAFDPRPVWERLEPAR